MCVPTWFAHVSDTRAGYISQLNSDTRRGKEVLRWEERLQLLVVVVSFLFSVTSSPYAAEVDQAQVCELFSAHAHEFDPDGQVLRGTE